mmetsp:Transcript_82367/g.233059  ORF Transcript_82367/g.233059 Transcript_82367/m.233059 type:complete len:312 (+) Transcript_82367:2079-3014(+)
MAHDAANDKAEEIVGTSQPAPLSALSAAASSSPSVPSPSPSDAIFSALTGASDRAGQGEDGGGSGGGGGGDGGSPTLPGAKLPGANVNTLDDNHRTPMFSAAWSGSVRCVEVLLAAGADPSIADKHNMRPLEKALECIKLCNKKPRDASTHRANEVNAKYSKKRLPDFKRIQKRLEAAMKEANVSLRPLPRLPSTPRSPRLQGGGRIMRNSSSSGWSAFGASTSAIDSDKDGNDEQDLNGFGPTDDAGAAVASAAEHAQPRPPLAPTPPTPNAPGVAGSSEEGGDGAWQTVPRRRNRGGPQAGLGRARAPL